MDAKQLKEELARQGLIQPSGWKSREYARTRGTTFDKQKNKWKARARGIFLGLFDNQEDAYKAAEAARKLLGMK